jgi:hypothetical protein
VRRTNEQYAREQHEAEQHAKDVEMFALFRATITAAIDALPTRPVPKPPVPATEDLHDKIASRINEARMIRAEKQQAQDMIRAEKRQAQDAHDRAIENLTIQLYERWYRTSAGPYSDVLYNSRSSQYYLDHRIRCQAQARSMLTEARMRVNQRQQDHAATAASR